MNELNFDLGVVTFKVNGNAEIHFNPTNPNFVGKLHDTFLNMKNQQESYEKEIQDIKDGDNSEIFNFCVRKDKEMREALDACFDEPVCEKVFGQLNVYAFAGGMPIWANFVLALFDVIEKYGEQEEKQMNDSVKKYLEKYRKH